MNNSGLLIAVSGGGVFKSQWWLGRIGRPCISLEGNYYPAPQPYLIEAANGYLNNTIAGCI